MAGGRAGWEGGPSLGAPEVLCMVCPPAGYLVPSRDVSLGLSPQTHSTSRSWHPWSPRGPAVTPQDREGPCTGHGAGAQVMPALW